MATKSQAFAKIANCIASQYTVVCRKSNSSMLRHLILDHERIMWQNIKLCWN